MILSQKGLDEDVCVTCNFFCSFLACYMCTGMGDSSITIHPGHLLKHTDVNQADTFPPSILFPPLHQLACAVQYQHVICHAVIVPPCLMLPMIAPAFGTSRPISFFYLDSQCGFSLPLSGEHRQFDFVLLLKHLCWAALCDRQGNDTASELSFNQAQKMCWLFKDK